jgi:heat shock protein HtpX
MPQANLNPDVQRRHNRRNTLHTIILVVGTALLMGVMAYSVLGNIGLIAAAIMGAIGMASIGRVSPKMVLGLYKARPLSPDEMPQLHEMVHELAKRANLPSVPQLHYVPSNMLNAFAVGRAEDSAIAVTDGLIRSMNLRQIHGILAHETAHIMNGDLKVMGMADVLNRITSLISKLGLFGLPLVFGIGVGLPLSGLALMIAAPTLGGLLQMGLSRAREYDADLDGATLSGDPEGLASALQVLEEKQQGMLQGRLMQPSFLRTHPKTEKRIAKLLALRKEATTQITIRPETARPQPSFVPPVSNPHIRWQRMGVYF